MIPRKVFWSQFIRSKVRSLHEDTSALDRVTDLYGLGGKWKCRPAGDGLASKTYILSSRKGKWALKQYRKEIQPQAIAFIHSILIQLEQLGFPACRLSLTPDGQHYVMIDGYCYAMFDYESGYHSGWFAMNKALRHLHIKQAGAALAHLHWLTADMVLQGHGNRGYKTAESRERWDSYSDYPDEWSELITRAFQIRNKEPLIPNTISKHINDKMVNLFQGENERALLPISITHGDYGPWNLLFRPFSGLISVIDFDDVSLEERIEEVAASIINFAADKSNNRINLEDGRVLLESYHQEYPLTLDELRALPMVLERYLLKRALTILRRYIVSWRRADYKKLLNIISWLDWLDSSGIVILQEMTASILDSTLRIEEQNEGISLNLV